MAIVPGVHPLAVIPVASLVCRLQGACFAIGLWVIAKVFSLIAAQASVLGGGSGISLVIGGIGSIKGPIIGTVLYVLLREFLADYGTLYLLFLGTLAVVVMLVAPKGLWGYAQTRFGWSLFPVGDRITFKD